MSCLGVCGDMAGLASPEAAATPAKEEDCDRDSGHHSGGEEECATHPPMVSISGGVVTFEQVHVQVPGPSSRRGSQEIKEIIGSRRGSLEIKEIIESRRGSHIEEIKQVIGSRKGSQEEITEAMESRRESIKEEEIKDVVESRRGSLKEEEADGNVGRRGSFPVGVPRRFSLAGAASRRGSYSVTRYVGSTMMIIFDKQEMSEENLSISFVTNLGREGDRQDAGASGLSAALTDKVGVKTEDSTTFR